MTVRYVRPISHSAYAARRIALAALLLFVLATLGHRFGPLRTPDFLALLLVSAAIAAAAVPLSLLGLMRLWQKGAEGGLASAKALIYAAIPIAVVAAGAVPYLTRPALHEVTTDTEDPPLFLTEPDYDQEWLRGRTAPTLADRRAQIGAYPGLTGRRYEGALDRVLEGVEAAALSSRITLQTRDEEDPDASQEPGDAPADEGVAFPLPQSVPVPLPRPGPRPTLEELPAANELLPTRGELLLQGEARTFFLGLPFDVVIRLREDEETTSVDVRIASRYGAHDLGLSAEIAEDFLDRLDAELLGIAGG
ncbi:hypothetical protein ABID21_000265 [Pseudorhizobium tarimense]|uniref:DUF1499 domain-containing protein n=1 Tax=Pseudorhizobium tarimense TaxID=1079109 RepID=A0ABV2H0W5_9HYPH|nr:DUF1499 domain-containing protein [Pseudorhizobium tarimense]MCJ8517500.1 DUF1499 domain-containing protein [Pseudorhizobium tarimense]